MPSIAAAASSFVHEADIYDLLRRAGLEAPRHGWLESDPPFRPGEPVVLKGLGEELWHKSEAGAVRFRDFDLERLRAEASAMRDRVASEHRWIGALVCECVAIKHPEGFPGEAFASLARGEGGWTLLMGFGGLRAEAMAELSAPLLWPVAWASPEEALAELSVHLLGRAWLGRLRQGSAITTEAQVRRFLLGLWRLAELAEGAGLELIELNPVVVDGAGELRPLDGVGRRGSPRPARVGPDPEQFRALLAPRSVALAGVSARPGGVGRTILDNLLRRDWEPGALRLVKPGSEHFLHLPCVPEVDALMADPVDLLILALPAPQTAEAVARMLEQGGGARAVMLVAGGLGDGADREGHGARITRALDAVRAEGGWTPTLVGPNCLGHLVPASGLDTLFIPADKVPRPPEGGVALLSQSGAFLLTQLSRHPDRGLALALALGNQLDLRFSDALAGLREAPRLRAVGAYVEGFADGDLEASARAIRTLRDRGVPTVLYRAGRTEGGRAAAASHTGAMAGDQALETALLHRAGARMAPTQEAFDAALAWAALHPGLGFGPFEVAIITNAGFESVTGGDLLVGPLKPFVLPPSRTARLAELLEGRGLAGLVAPRLPLDLTPMAGAEAYLEAAALVLEAGADVLVMGLVPFARHLPMAGEALSAFAGALSDLARATRRPVGLVVDAGPDYEAARRALARAGLPVFTRMEAALEGLRVLAGGT